jgi:glycine/D-amino acid oxidase-like deaminating enzyme
VPVPPSGAREPGSAGDLAVVVIGAGVHGASAAYHLARAGASVILIERGSVAGGPTGLSSGVCRAYYTNPFLAAAARDSIALMRSFDEVSPDHDAGFRHTGFLYLHPPEDAAAVRDSVATLNQLGIAVDLLETDALAREHPQLVLDGIGIGAFERDAGYADPSGTTAGLAAGAIAAGAQVRTHTSVERVAARTGGGARLRLSDGTDLEAERLLIAAGPWTVPLARQVGAELPLTVERHVVATAQLDRDRGLACGHGDLVTGYYCRPEGADQYLMGWTHEADNVDPDRFERRIRPDEEEALLGAVARRMPALLDARPRRGWASLYDVSPDWQPVIGEIADGVFVDAGTSGHGFKLAPALGRHVADMVLGHPPPDLAQFSPSRFDAGEMLSAGYRDARILG